MLDKKYKAFLRTCPHSELPYYMTVEEAMARIDEKNQQVFWRWIRQGKVPARKFGGLYRIQRDFFA